MPTRPFRVGRSSTGLGLFAVRPIKRRQYIVTYSGPLITNDEAERLESRNARYLFELNSQWTINGVSRRNLGRYANHSCRPNAEAVQRRGTKKLVLVAQRAIAPGEEITYDYGKDYVDSFFKPKGCRCAACVKKRRRRRARKREAKRRAPVRSR
jgi:SET domain-containing protein